MKKQRQAQRSQVSETVIRAVALQEEGRAEEAEKLFRAWLVGNPRDAVALYSMGVILMSRREVDAAMAMLDAGVAAAPRFAPLWFARGGALNIAARREEALASYDRAIELDPKYVAALINSGVLLRDLRRPKDALERFNRVLAIENNEKALANCGAMLEAYGATAEAMVMYQRLLAINPLYDYGLGLLAYQKRRLCDWTDHDTLRQQVVTDVMAGKRACSALALMVMSDQAAEHQACSRTYAQQHFPISDRLLWHGERYQHDKIRIAYVSPDLREHPVGHLMAGVLERHDKTRFETYAISLGSDDQSRLRARMIKAFDHFIDAEMMETRQIAELMRSLEIDIAIDLGGLTTDTRTAIFSHRPAPVQVNYLGFPGTMGTDYMDVILADRQVIPPEHQRYYNEKVVYLPDSYLPTDASVKISDRTPSRTECGLPETGFVFCSFSHDHKISPDMFDVWMRLLLQVPGSVLWLMSRKDEAVQNLRKEAQARGVAPDRLIFAGRVPLVEDHLARYRQADLFIDTYPYNAHTTAADALMAGLPVITCVGHAFPSRVAGSLLHAIGLSELITDSLDDYEALALALAEQPNRLSEFRARLLINRGIYPLFDTAMFCRNFEQTLSQIHTGQQAVDLPALSDEGQAPRVDLEQKSIASDVSADPATQPKGMADEPKVAKKRCLHLGGLARTAGWEVISDAPGAVVDHAGSVSDLSRFTDNSFDVLYSHHMLEKLDYREQLLGTLVEWRRVLKPGGVLAVTVNDLELLAAKLIDKRLDLSERFMVMRMIYGGHMDKSDYHQVGLTEEILVSFLIGAGFAQARRVASFNGLELIIPPGNFNAPTDLHILAEKYVDEAVSIPIFVKTL